MSNSKNRNFGYLFGTLMLIIFIAVTAVILWLSWDRLTKDFASSNFFAFLGNYKNNICFTKGMSALFIFDLFCLGATILGFVQGALHKKRD